MTDSTLWYLSRGTGFTSMVLLTLVMALGVLSRSAKPLPGLPRFVTAGLHRNASLLAVGFVAVHVGAAVADPYALTGVLDIVVPFLGGYRPLWIGLGTVALDLLIAVAATSLLRHRLPDHAWRAVHWTAYACWPVALLHGVASGPDAATDWSLALTVVCVALVGATVAWRTSSPVFRSAQVAHR
jgi:sulfoxide reductase heme-binding subunit YedZ